MPMSEAQLRANSKHLAEHYESIAVRSRKDDRMGERLEIAARRRNTSKRDYILTVLREALEKDGVTVDTYD